VATHLLQWLLWGGQRVRQTQRRERCSAGHWRHGAAELELQGGTACSVHVPSASSQAVSKCMGLHALPVLQALISLRMHAAW
jgi:hypothetical protein